MRYIGGKSLLLNNIHSVIEKYTDKNINTVTDLFSGSGVVGVDMKDKGYGVVSNDLLYFSYVIARGNIGINKKLSFSRLKESGINNVIEHLNNLKIEDTEFNIKDCFIYQNYSPTDSCSRMYFQNSNALKIDIIRLQLKEWREKELLSNDEYFYLLASLLLAVPYVANITGTFGAYLKYWDKRTFNKLELKEHEIKIGKDCQCLWGDYTKALEIKTDLLYADPPYNSREYLPNYHVMETIARYDYPMIKGVTGIREYSSEKSVFCKKASVVSAFDTLLKNAKSKYIIISYNNEGLISTEELSSLCKKYAKLNTFHLVECDYRRYKNKIPNNKAGLKEQLYFLEKINE